MKITYFISSRFSRDRSRAAGAHLFYRPTRQHATPGIGTTPYRPEHIGAGLVRRTLVQPR